MGAGCTLPRRVATPAPLLLTDATSGKASLGTLELPGGAAAAATVSNAALALPPALPGAASAAEPTAKSSAARARAKPWSAMLALRS